VDFSNSGVSLVPGENFGSVYADWDTDISKPRIVWTEKDGDYYKVNAARVTLSNGQPSGISYQDVISDNTSYDALNPTIVMNRFQGTEEEKEEAFEAFSSYTEGSVAYRVDLEASSGVDNWHDPETVVPDDLVENEESVTYRTFGSPKHIWGQYVDTVTCIFTDDGFLDNSTNVGCVHLYTSRKKDWNIYSSYRQGSGSVEKLIIRHLVP